MSFLMNFLVEKVLPLVLAVLLITLLALIALMPFGIYASYVCLQNGYPRGYFELPYEIKCGRIINQTEYICPLSDVLSNSCLPIEDGR